MAFVQVLYKSRKRKGILLFLAKIFLVFYLLMNIGKMRQYFSGLLTVASVACYIWLSIALLWCDCGSGNGYGGRGENGGNIVSMV